MSSVRGYSRKFRKNAQSNIRHSFRTSFLHQEVQELRTKIKLLENSGEFQKIGIKRLLKTLLKTAPWMDGILSWKALVWWSAVLQMTASHCSLSIHYKNASSEFQITSNAAWCSTFLQALFLLSAVANLVYSVPLKHQSTEYVTPLCLNLHNITSCLEKGGFL